MKWPTLDESVSFFICLLIVACNHEMQPCLLAIRCGGGGIVFGFGSGSGSTFNCASRVGSDNLGYGPGSGFNFKPVQTSSSLYPWWLIS